MRSHLRTIVVLALAVGLLALFLPNVDLRGVRARDRARAAGVAGAVAGDDVRQPGDPRLALAVPARAARPDAASPTRFARRPSGLRRAASCRARRRGHSPIFPRAPRTDERDRRVRDDHPRAPARHADGARAAGVVRLRLRPRSRRGESGRVRRGEVGRRHGRGRRARRARGRCSFSPGIRRGSGRRSTRLEQVLPSAFAALLGRIAEKFATGLGAIRRPGRLLVALFWSFPLWLSIVLGIWAAAVAFRLAIPFTGSFLIMALLVIGVAVPTPGAVGGFHEAFRFGATMFFGAPNTPPSAPRSCCTSFDRPVAAARACSSRRRRG